MGAADRSRDPAQQMTSSSNESGVNAAITPDQPNIAYIPIVMFCCPNIIRNEPCLCGP